MKRKDINVGIIGLGFLGGSLAKSLIKLERVKKIVALDKNVDSLEKAFSDKVITDYTTCVNEKFSDCDIIFVCTPVSIIVDYVKKLEKVVKRDCIITDIGSTKKTVLDGVADLDVTFIGAHPMIGSERSGYEVSRELLFEHSYYIITNGNKNTLADLEELKSLLIEIGAIPIIIDGNRHDYITAVISHIPHIVAYSLVRLVKDLDSEDEVMKTLAAGGFKDITRIASSDPTMWENICFENKKEIIKVLNIFEKILSDFKDKLDDREEVYKFFEESKEYRDGFINRKINGESRPEINIVIKDESGSIAKVVDVLSKHKIDIANIEILNNKENNFGALKVVLKSYEERDKAYDIVKNIGYDIVKIN